MGRVALNEPALDRSWLGMSSRKTARHQKQNRDKHTKLIAQKSEVHTRQGAEQKRLEIVLKCDTSGCAEAIISSIKSISTPALRIDIISSGVGSVNKSDIFMAETGSRLIIGFNVGLIPQADVLAAEHNVEVRLFDVIYRLVEDIESIVASLMPREFSEQIIGTARVIALFKSSRKGIILGCEVIGGRLALQQSFRIVGAMGPKYIGTIESLHIENDAVREATRGQQVGLKIRDFNKVRMGDLVEAFQPTAKYHVTSWHPQGKIFYP
jgi:translation initiation factor IF-2